MPFWLFRAVFLHPRPYEITSLKSNIVKSIEAYYMYSILLPFFYLFFFLVYDLKLLHNHMKFISMCPLFACPGIDLYYLYEIQAIMIFLSLLIHVPKPSENWGFDGKVFFVFLFSDVNGTLTSFLTSCRKITNEIENFCSANLLEKNLLVCNSILPTITVPFFAVFSSEMWGGNHTIQSLWSF